MEEYEKRIINALQIEDNNEKKENVRQILADLDTFLKDKDWRSKAKILSDINIDFKEKLNFFMIASECKDDKLKGFTSELIPYCFNEAIKNNKEDFFKVITDNLEIQRLYTDYFKNRHCNNEEIQDNMEYLLSLPLFKELVLEDEEFISNKMIGNLNFFENLPKEYGYLISLYYSSTYDDYKEIYQKYFGNILNDEQLDELIKFQIDMNKRPNILRISQKEKMAGIKYVLSESIKDNKFYEKMKAIQERTHLDMKSVISFTYKYHNTELYEWLLKSKDKLSDEIIEKIEYLSKEDKLTDIEKLEHIDLLSMSDLRDMPKERKTEIKSNLQGGPHANTFERAFENSESREIRRIDKNGANVILPLNYKEDHTDGVEKIYEGDIEFTEECTLALERAMKAAKQLSSITYVIENEQCFVYVPSDLSLEQKKVSIDWLRLANDCGVIGILIYDRNLEESYIANEGDFFDKNSAIEFVLNLGEKITEEELDKIVIQGRDEQGKKGTTMMDLAKKAIADNTKMSDMKEIETQLPSEKEVDVTDKKRLDNGGPYKEKVTDSEWEDEWLTGEEMEEWEDEEWTDDDRKL